MTYWAVGYGCFNQKRQGIAMFCSILSKMKLDSTILKHLKLFLQFTSLLILSIILLAKPDVERVASNLPLGSVFLPPANPNDPTYNQVRAMIIALDSRLKEVENETIKKKIVSFVFEKPWVAWFFFATAASALLIDLVLLRRERAETKVKLVTSKSSETAMSEPDAKATLRPWNDPMRPWISEMRRIYEKSVLNSQHQILNWLFTMNAGGLTGVLAFMVSSHKNVCAYWSLALFSLGLLAILGYGATMFYFNVARYNQFDAASERYNIGQVEPDVYVKEVNAISNWSTLAHMFAVISGVCAVGAVVFGICMVQ